MKVVEQLIDYCRANGLLSGEQVDALVRLGVLPEQDRYAGYDDCHSYCRSCGEEYCNGGCAHWYGVLDSALDSLDRDQEELAQVHARAGKALWHVGRSRRRWWGGYQVSQVARARRLRARR